MQILVISGGSSDEREVSLRSGQNVAAALGAAGYEVRQYDPQTADDSLKKAVSGCDCVFLALHGAGGEDGTIQAQLEQLGVPYIGSGVYASELCFDKWNYRALLKSHGLQMAPGKLVDAANFATSPLTHEPYVLKPPKGGSSIDTILAHDPLAVDQATVAADFAKHHQLLLEKMIIGTEITMGVVGNEALPAIEIIPPEGKDFDYENKYNGATQELCPPQHVDEAIQKQAQALALKIHTLCGCSGFSRTDMMVDKNDELYVLETNTIPGLTEQSLLPKAAAVAGMNMSALVKSLVEDALQRFSAA